MFIRIAMEGINYRFPFNPSALMTENGSIETCDIAESIAQNIMLLIITKKGENRYDENYGNDVWNVEFDNGVSSAVWENVFINSLKRQISDYEHRLVNPQIKAHIVFVEHNYDTRNFTEIKKKVKIAINAKLEATGEQFNFATELFLSPMSID
ncbi:GPW/gp25 family protein [Elizabethkingia ursingii]|nr:GPW/gp25 family protein [Elizabethkingia ursingii]MCL1669772.1 GPW/gp25 family protein [Elizabethkingia ursingii]